MKTFIATAVDASAVQQALSGLRTPVPLNHIPRDEQVLFLSNILGPVRILITANLDLISVLLDARSTSLSLRADFDDFFWKNCKLYPVHPIYSTHPNHQPNFSTFSLKEPLNVMPQKSYLSLGNYVFSDLSHLNIRPMTSFRLVIKTQTNHSQPGPRVCFGDHKYTYLSLCNGEPAGKFWSRCGDQRLCSRLIFLIDH